MQYSIHLAFHFAGALVLFPFFMFKAREYVSNQTVRMWIFDFLISPRSSKVLWYQVPWISSILTLSINVRLKLTRVFCILNSNGIDSVKWVLLIKSCIEQNILFLRFIWKIRVMLYYKVFRFKLFFSFWSFNVLF